MRTHRRQIELLRVRYHNVDPAEDHVRAESPLHERMYMQDDLDRSLIALLARHDPVRVRVDDPDQKRTHTDGPLPGRYPIDHHERIKKTIPKRETLQQNSPVAGIADDKL